jgi:hypothetical protein
LPPPVSAAITVFERGPKFGPIERPIIVGIGSFKVRKVGLRLLFGNGWIA